VTAADRAAEVYIRSQIEKIWPNDAIVGEEFGESSHPGSLNRWIIDPIDGTKSFMRGVPLYAVLIGLEIEGRIRVGAAYFPPLDQMLCAAEGMGAWCNGRRVHVSGIDQLEMACVCYTSVQHLVDRDPGIWNHLSRSVYMTRGWSDS
jgi:myo-inositol-1(or 4)-monophosphatase